MFSRREPRDNDCGGVRSIGQLIAIIETNMPILILMLGVSRAYKWSY